MKLHTPSRQLRILAETIPVVNSETSEEAKVNSILDAIQSLGFPPEIRCRVSVVTQNTVWVIKYARGEYGGFNITGIRYNLENSLAAKAVLGAKSFVFMHIRKKQRIIGSLIIDSQKNSTFSRKSLDVLQPYADLLAAVLEPEVERDRSPMTFITRLREKHVLVLGKDTGDEVQRLLDIATYLQARGYDPLMVKDHPDIPELSNEEKARVLADISRFVLLENSFPAGQIAECKVCSTNRIVTAVLREEGKGSSYMVTDYFKDFDFMQEFLFQGTQESMQEALGIAIQWAENKLNERARYFNERYPWRSQAPAEK